MTWSYNIYRGDKDRRRNVAAGLPSLDQWQTNYERFIDDCQAVRHVDDQGRRQFFQRYNIVVAPMLHSLGRPSTSGPICWRLRTRQKSRKSTSFYLLDKVKHRNIYLQ